MLQVARKAIFIPLAVIGIGCGRGLTCDLNATPDPANPGQSVQWNLSLRNDTECATVAQPINLPDPLPDSAGALGFIFGFVPGLDQRGAENFCRMFVTNMAACSDQSCVAAHLQEALGPEIASSLHARMQAATSEPPVSLPAAGTCEVIDIGLEGTLGICAFDPLAPGETGTATLTDTAPDTGSTKAAQIAMAFAPAQGQDCRPGREGSSGEWMLSGCCPLGTETAPTLSPAATVAGAATLLMIGVLGLYQRRKS